MGFRRVSGAVAGLLLAAACSLTPDDTSSLNLYVSVDDGVLLDGEVMTVTLTARNVGYDPLTLTGPGDCLLYIEVLDNQGSVVYNSLGSCTGSSVTEEILPGEDKTQSVLWNGVNFAGARLAPGFYHVRGVARVTGGLYNSPLVSIALEGGSEGLIRGPVVRNAP